MVYVLFTVVLFLRRWYDHGISFSLSFLFLLSFLSLLFFSLFIIAAVSGDSMAIWKFTFLLRIGEELLSNTNIYFPASTDSMRLDIGPLVS